MNYVYQMQQNMWAFSPYQILFWAAIIYILIKCRKQTQVKWLAIYSILVYLVTVYTPFAVTFVLNYVFNDLAAYYRVFYLAPVIPIVAYVATCVHEVASKKLSENLSGRKINKNVLKAAVAIVLVAVLCVLGDFSEYKTVYRWPENIYKVSQDAVDICDAIESETGGGTVGIYLPVESNWWNDDFYYGVRQYYAGVIEYGYIPDEEKETVITNLKSAIANSDISYIVVQDSNTEAIALMESCGERLVVTGDRYILYCKQ